MKKNKKIVMSLILLFVIGIVVGTFAIFNSSVPFINNFLSGTYVAKMYETFESPSNWELGTTTPKEVYVENKGSIPIAVRARFQKQEWKSKNNTYLPLKQTQQIDGEEILVEAAIINFAENSGWTKNEEDGWYYYNSNLAQNEKTNAFIESVTFNKDIILDMNCNEEGTGCTTSNEGYAGATFTLVVEIQTAQANKASQIFGNNLNQDNKLTWKKVKHLSLGDSLMRGSGNEDKGYSEYIAQAKGTEKYLNYSYGGSVLNSNPIWINSKEYVNTNPSYFKSSIPQMLDNIINKNPKNDPNVPSWLLTEKPDIILIDGGGNDLLQYKTPTSYATLQNTKNAEELGVELDTILTKIKTNFPDTKVLYINNTSTSDNGFFRVFMYSQLLAGLRASKSFDAIKGTFGCNIPISSNPYADMRVCSIDDTNADEIFNDINEQQRMVDFVKEFGNVMNQGYMLEKKDAASELWDNIIPRIIREHGYDYLDLGPEIDRNPQLYLQSDKLHISAAGYEYLSSKVTAKMEEILNIS